jgi:hypothetical protein
VNFTVSSSDLRKILERLKVGRGRDLWAGHLYLDGDDGHLVATTVSPDGVGVEAFADTADYDLGEATIPLGELDSWLAGVDGDVTAELDTFLDVLTFSAADAALPVPTIADHETALPSEPDQELALPDAVWPALRRVAWAADQDSDRTKWKAMLHLAPGYAFATDSYKMAMQAVEGLDEQVALYPEAAAILREMDMASTRVTVDRNRRIHFADDRGRFVVPTYAGTDSPPLSTMHNVMGSVQADETLTVNRKELHDALGRLGPLREKQGDGAKRVWLVPNGLTLTLMVRTDHGQLATREIGCTGNAGPICVNLTFLRSSLEAIGADDVVLAIDGEKLPIKMTEGDYSAVLMPIRGDIPKPPAKRTKGPRF